MCKNPIFRERLKRPFERKLNAFQTIFKSKPLRHFHRSGLFMQQPFRVSRGNYPLSFLYLAAILSVQNLSRIVDKVVRV